jgi:ABC-2 type transport system ATP-binding protein
MGASQFVGRVGGLAVALGIGAGVFAGGAGVAWADRSGGPGDSGSTSSADGASDAPRGRATEADTDFEDTAVESAPAEAELIDPVELELEAKPEPRIHIDPVVEEPPVGTVDPVDESTVGPTDETSVETTDKTTEGTTEEQAVEPPTGGLDPVPVAPEEPQTVVVADPGDVGEVAVVAVESRTAVPLLTALNATTTSAPTANANTAPLTAAPVSTYFDGILQGNLNVTSASGCGLVGSTCKLTYTFVDSSDGGKATIGNVPVALSPLLPDGAKGGDGSYTFLPYATWIDPANPTNLPTPTGTQDFRVRVTENTAFNQTVTSIPLIGMLAAPIIDLLQQLPLISSLLIPLIGASMTTTVSVNVGQLSGGKQVAYTYIVDSFDGTPISMNYFPASQTSLVFPGQRQSTIFNGPGLGSPGETNPYGLFQAAGSVPGLSIMRGQGLPAPFDAAPIGFNVITWDPRGEFASGGVLQLDSPFFEGRDVSSLIDWSLANTPVLNAVDRDPDDPTTPGTGPAVPQIAMMGGSYGGGIQLTTVDPRIKAIVPAIAWNSLNSSLYPTDVFKTAWANTFALALLETGADINPLINQGVLFGNLFGFLTEEQQAALASSGPTVLLTKLSIPTMYNQGTIDALFPLQQAIDNAQTQLDQNPYFAGDNADKVKMIWFCGGHGVCTTQSAQQQTAQNTLMFLENMLWVNNYAKPVLWDVPIDPSSNPLSADNLGELVAVVTAVIPVFQWWDQNGNALAADQMPWTSDFQNLPPITAANVTGGRINSFTSRSGPLTSDDPAGAVCTGLAQACEFPLNQVFATKAQNAVNVDITIPYSTTKPGDLDPTKDQLVPSTIVGAPLVSFTYKGSGNAKAVYAQVVDNATGQVLGNINTAIPVVLDGKERTVEDFPIANIAYTAGEAIGGSNSLTLQILANSSLYQNNAVIWSVDISNLSVSVPQTDKAKPNIVSAFLPV